MISDRQVEEALRQWFPTWDMCVKENDPENEQMRADMRRALEAADKAALAPDEKISDIIFDAARRALETGAPRIAAPVRFAIARSIAHRAAHDLAAKQYQDNSLRQETDDLRAICWAAWRELNEIRARDGVPYTHQGYKASVDESYFSSVVDTLAFVLGDDTNPWPNKKWCDPDGTISIFNKATGLDTP